MRIQGVKVENPGYPDFKKDLRIWEIAGRLPLDLSDHLILRQSVNPFTPRHLSFSRTSLSRSPLSRTATLTQKTPRAQCPFFVRRCSAVRYRCCSAGRAVYGCTGTVYRHTSIPHSVQAYRTVYRHTAQCTGIPTMTPNSPTMTPYSSSSSVNDNVQFFIVRQ